MARRVYGGSPITETQNTVTEEKQDKSDLKEPELVSELTVFAVPEPPKPKKRRSYGAPLDPSPVEEEKTEEPEEDPVAAAEIRAVEQSIAKRKKQARIKFIIVSSIFAVIIGVLGFFALQYHQQDLEVSQMWDDVRHAAYVPSEEQQYTATIGDPQQLEAALAYPDDPMERLINWEKLKSVSPNVLCWVYIPGTNIDYPVMQEQNRFETYYLNHDAYGKYCYSGSIFALKGPDDVEDAHQVFYGHNMINGSMFGSLRKYKAEDYYKAHPYIYVYYPDRTERWIVWSAYATTQADEIYNVPYVKDSPEYKVLIDNINRNKNYSTSCGTVTSSMNTLTLSTCNNSGGSHDKRFVVTSIISDIKWLNNDARIEYEQAEQERQDEIDRARQERNRTGNNVDHYTINFGGDNDE